eukprot:351235-Chlamydomonas_euryale.AAC.4
MARGMRHGIEHVAWDWACGMAQGMRHGIGHAAWHGACSMARACGMARGMQRSAGVPGSARMRRRGRTNAPSPPCACTRLAGCTDMRSPLQAAAWTPTPFARHRRPRPAPMVSAATGWEVGWAAPGGAAGAVAAARA